MAHEILTNSQMAEADRLTIKAGVPGFDLMQNAGQAVAGVVMDKFSRRRVLILCGPGNNGGDGFIVANLLKERGWNVRLACLAPEKLKGDAAKAEEQWDGDVESFEGLQIQENELIIDAVFGTGFSGQIKSPVKEVLQQINAQDVVAVDIPSGVNGSNGDVADVTPKAKVTVTFCRKKLGHVLEPGKSHCGEIIVADIGIPDSAVEKAGAAALENHPDLWQGLLHPKQPEAHKYNYGHAVIFGAPKLTGATRLAADACARFAGLTSVIAPEGTGEIYRSTLSPDILVEDIEWREALAADKKTTYQTMVHHFTDKRRTALLAGPGGGDPEFFRNLAYRAWEQKHLNGIVLDAEAFKAWERDGVEEFHAFVSVPTIVTPHEGEFHHVFDTSIRHKDVLEGNKLEQAKKAAELMDAIVVLKGSDTVIAAPDGRSVINAHSSPDLATAGTGDVLAGMITGLLARGVEPFWASCAAVWIHGEAAQRFGPGLVASDLPGLIPEILAELS